MSHLDQVVDFCTSTDVSHLQSRTINCCTGPNLDVVINNNNTNLRDFKPGLAVRHIAKTIGTNYRAVMDCHAVPNPAPLSYAHSGMKSNIVSHYCPFIKGNIRIDRNPVTYSNPISNTDTGVDACIHTDNSILTDKGSSHYAFGNPGPGSKQGKEFGKSKVWVGQNYSIMAKSIGPRRQYDCRSLCCLNFLCVLGVCEKSNLSLCRIIQRAKPVNTNIGITYNLTAKVIG